MYSRLDSDQTRFMKLPQASASPSLKPLNPSSETDPAKLGAVARKFEALFMQMMLKSMRTAGFGGGALDSKGSEFYQQMYDERLSSVLSGVEGDGTSRKPTSYLGLADMLVRQLGGPQGASPTSQASAEPSPSSAPVTQSLSKPAVAASPVDSGPADSGPVPFAQAAPSNTVEAVQAVHKGQELGSTTRTEAIVSDNRQAAQAQPDQRSPASGENRVNAYLNAYLTGNRIDDETPELFAGQGKSLVYGPALATKRGPETPATVAPVAPNDSQAMGNHPGLVGYGSRGQGVAVDAKGVNGVPSKAVSSAGSASPTNPSKGSSSSVGVSDPGTVAGAAAQDAGLTKRRTFESPEAFIREMWPFAERAAQMIGGSPRAILAQAALETGWGKHIAATQSGENSHNLFGIKATDAWKGARTVKPTLEFEGGAMRVAREPFRVYESFEQSFNDYAQLLASSGRYRQAVNSAANPSAFFSALQTAGYATDPNYAKKLSAIAEGDVMRDAIASLRSA